MTQWHYGISLFFSGALVGLISATLIFIKRREDTDIVNLVRYLKALVSQDQHTLHRVIDTAIHHDHDTCRKVLKEGIDQLGYEVAKQRIFTLPGIIITFEPNDFHGFNDDLVERQLKTILAAYPGADIRKHEKALGIRIIDVQRRPGGAPPEPPSSAYI